MATQTEKLGLLKPTYDEPADIDVLNGNMDKIDDFAKDISELKPNVAEITSAGWYRVAQINNSACSFSMKIYEHSDGQTYPEMYDLNIDVAQATNSQVIINIVQTNSNRPHDTQKIQKIRVVTNKSLIHYVEIYLADSSLLTMVKVHNLYPNNVLSYLNFKNGSVPSGYTATEFTPSSNPVKTSKFEGDLDGSNINVTSATMGNAHITGDYLNFENDSGELDGIFTINGYTTMGHMKVQISDIEKSNGIGTFTNAYGATTESAVMVMRSNQTTAGSNWHVVNAWCSADNTIKMIFQDSNGASTTPTSGAVSIWWSVERRGV